MKTNFNNHYTEINADAVRNRVKKMLAFRDEVNPFKAVVKFSYGNRKTGALIPSVSLIPVADCGNCSQCSRGCYAVKHVAIYPGVQKQVANNSAMAHGNPAKYFEDIANEVKFRAFFRWHVQGDILNSDYFANMVRIAEITPNCQFLAFTKMFSIVNEWIGQNGELPKNLHVIFSDWKNQKMNNPPQIAYFFANLGEWRNRRKCNGKKVYVSRILRRMCKNQLRMLERPKR